LSGAQDGYEHGVHDEHVCGLGDAHVAALMFNLPVFVTGEVGDRWAY